MIHPAVDGVAGSQSIVDYDRSEGDRPGAGQFGRSFIAAVLVADLTAGPQRMAGPLSGLGQQRRPISSEPDRGEAVGPFRIDAFLPG